MYEMWGSCQIQWMCGLRLHRPNVIPEIVTIQVSAEALYFMLPQLAPVFQVPAIQMHLSA